MSFFAMQAYIKLSEGKADATKGQEEKMAKYVDILIADWAEMNGSYHIQGKKVDELADHFKLLHTMTNAGPILTVQYSKYSNTKQTKYSGKQLLKLAKEVRKLIQRDAYPWWLEICEKGKSADHAGPRSGMNYDQVLEQLRQVSYARKRDAEDAEKDDSSADEGEGDAGSVSPRPAGPIPVEYKPSWWLTFQLLGPWGSNKYKYGTESQLIPVKSGANGPDAASATFITKKEETSRRNQAKQQKLDDLLDKKKEAHRKDIENEMAAQRALAEKSIMMDEYRLRFQGLQHLVEMLSKPSLEELDSDEDEDSKLRAKKERKAQLKAATAEYRSLIMRGTVMKTDLPTFTGPAVSPGAGSSALSSTSSSATESMKSSASAMAALSVEEASPTVSKDDEVDYDDVDDYSPPIDLLENDVTYSQAPPSVSMESVSLDDVSGLATPSASMGLASTAAAAETLVHLTETLNENIIKNPSTKRPAAALVTPHSGWVKRTKKYDGPRVDPYDKLGRRSKIPKKHFSP
jgi:hypothetical protein